MSLEAASVPGGSEIAIEVSRKQWLRSAIGGAPRAGRAALLSKCLRLRLRFPLVMRWFLGSAALPVWFLITDTCSQEVTFTARRKVILQ